MKRERRVRKCVSEIVEIREWERRREKERERGESGKEKVR